MNGNDSTGVRIYRYSKLMMLNVINDLVELQKGEVTFHDISKGQIYFTVEMYGFIWENRFTVEAASEGQSRITLCIKGSSLNDANKVAGQFALLDALLVSFLRGEP